MNETLSCEVSITVDASTAEVWTAITKPHLIKQYLMGTDVTSDWKEGSLITYKGENQGKPFHDKGINKKSEPGRIFQSTYLSSEGGKEDKPENYNLVTYQLTPFEGKTAVLLTQDNILSEKEKIQVKGGWNTVLQRLKEVVETKW